MKPILLAVLAASLLVIPLNEKAISASFSVVKTKIEKAFSYKAFWVKSGITHEKLFTDEDIFLRKIIFLLRY